MQAWRATCFWHENGCLDESKLLKLKTNCCPLVEHKYFHNYILHVYNRIKLWGKGRARFWLRFYVEDGLFPISSLRLFGQRTENEKPDLPHSPVVWGHQVLSVLKEGEDLVHTLKSEKPHWLMRAECEQLIHIFDQVIFCIFIILERKNIVRSAFSITGKLVNLV